MIFERYVGKSVAGLRDLASFTLMFVPSDTILKLRSNG